MSTNHDHEFAPEGDTHESHPEAHVTDHVHGRHQRDHQPRKAGRDAEHNHGEHRGHGGGSPRVQWRAGCAVSAVAGPVVVSA